MKLPLSKEQIDRWYGNADTSEATDMDVLHSHEALQADVVYLAARAERAGRCSFEENRDFGVSSDAIVRLAYGGPAPRPDEMPSDGQDYLACQLAVMRLPGHRRTEEVLAALRTAEAAWKGYEEEVGRCR
jgi:hypothetical protein